MAHKVKIGGTNYEVTGGRTLIGATGYDVSDGNTKIAATGYDVKFRGAPTSVWVTGAVTGNWSNPPAGFNKITEYSINGGAFTQITGSDVYVTTDIHAGDMVTIKSTIIVSVYGNVSGGSCKIVYNGTEVVAYPSAGGTIYTFVAGESITIRGADSQGEGYAIYITNQ